MHQLFICWYVMIVNMYILYMYLLKGRAYVPVGPVILESSALRAHTLLLVTYVVRVLLGLLAMDKHAYQGQQTVSCYSLYITYHYK